MPNSLQNKIVVVTGASSGFGADAARLFAREGAVVVLVARRVSLLKALAAEIEAAGGMTFILPLDLASTSHLEEGVQRIIDRYGRIDILINNAGYGRLNWLEELEPREDIENQVAVNLRGLILFTRCVLPHMYQQRSGQIINMSSIAGFIAPPLYTIYAATKHGVRGFTDALRREAAAFGVRVSGIYPGPAVTEFSQHTGDNPIKRSIKLPRFMSLRSETVARWMVRLAIHPRRTVILPGYYRLVIILTYIFPGLVDWILTEFFVRRFHQFPPDGKVS